jgi:NAD-dependent SIR2 family protein deacetylase
VNSLSSDIPNPTQIHLAAQAVECADALLITAGAGMGVDSGLPDFRGSQGFWRAYPAIAKLGLSFAEMANPSWFERSPKLAWAFYGHRLNLYRRTTPHAGFKRLLEIGTLMPQGYFVFTSNVDGQFQKAGFAEDRIVECHGSIHHFQCTSPCKDEIWSASLEEVQIEEEPFRAAEPLPHCRHCDSLARPNVLMFCDGTWIPHRTTAQEQRMVQWLTDLQRSAARLAVIELGAGPTVPTVRLTSERIVRETTGTLIRINPRDNTVPEGQIGLPMSASEGLSRICERLAAFTERSI